MSQGLLANFKSCYTAIMETVTTEKRKMTITDTDGKQHEVIGKVITTDHGVKDENGIPKVSVEVKVPSILIGATPGKVE